MGARAELGGAVTKVNGYEGAEDVDQAEGRAVRVKVLLWRAGQRGYAAE